MHQKSLCLLHIHVFPPQLFLYIHSPILLLVSPGDYKRWWCSENACEIKNVLEPQPHLVAQACKMTLRWELCAGTPSREAIIFFFCFFPFSCRCQYSLLGKQFGTEMNPGRSSAPLVPTAFLILFIVPPTLLIAQRQCFSFIVGEWLIAQQNVNPCL